MGHASIVEMLLAAGARSDLKNDKEQTALLLAAGQPKREAVVAILAKSAKNILNVPGPRGMTPLMETVRFGLINSASVLMKEGADLDALVPRGHYTALHLAVAENQTELARRLVEAGAKPDIPDIHGTTPMLLACGYGWSEIVLILGASGGNSSRADQDGLTCLMHAAEIGSLPIVNMLLQVDAKDTLNNVNDDGRSALMLACREGKGEVVERLIKAKADLDIVDNDGLDLVMSAALGGSATAMRALTGSGAKVDGVSKELWTSLAIASATNHSEVLYALLLTEARAQIDYHGHKGFTPLMWACAHNHMQVARMLIEAGAKVELATPSGASAMRIAKTEALADVADLLKLHGAAEVQPDAQIYEAGAAYNEFTETARMKEEIHHDMQQHQDEAPPSPFEVHDHEQVVDENEPPPEPEEPQPELEGEEGDSDAPPATGDSEDEPENDL
eukprot:NODE_61_length_1507_cov_332.471098_g58_i0.p1 GENE.NODE_61_length_1507_cov_332.471098_g58_i0~~NODE_61_length_1507_cov_332.471098_g58_i0.p1  ORF type:complete len:457 (+),score=63.33 NODE_61_length_1507_cov_332.471098_g58_i0:32-1372(+)